MVVVAALAALGVAGCGGSSSPQVASLGKSTGGTAVSTTTLPKGNPTQLLDEWASCMRANGVPNLADPTITSSGAIHIIMPANASPGAIGGAGNSGSGSSNPCNNYLQAASQALSGKSGGAGAQPPDPAKLLKFSECMQKSGFPQFPDPSSGGLSLKIQPGSTMNPNNPAFINASKTCSKKAGVPGFGDPGSAPAGAIQVQSGSGPSGGPGGNGGSGAVIGNSGGGQSSSGFSTGGSGG